MKKIHIPVLFLIFNLSTADALSRKSYLESKEEQIKKEISRIELTISRLQTLMRSNSMKCSRSSSPIQCNSQQRAHQVSLQNAISSKQDKYLKLQDVQNQLMEVQEKEIDEENRRRIASQQDEFEPLEEDVDYEEELDLDFNLSADDVEAERKTHQENFVYNIEPDTLRPLADAVAQKKGKRERIEENTAESEALRAPASLSTEEEKTAKIETSMRKKGPISLDEIIKLMEKSGFSKASLQPGLIYRNALNTHHAGHENPMFSGELTYIETREKYIFYSKKTEMRPKVAATYVKSLVDLLGTVFGDRPETSRLQSSIIDLFTQVASGKFKDPVEQEHGDLTIKLKLKESEDPKKVIINFKISGKKPQL